MNRVVKSIAAGLGGLAVCTALSANALQVTVQFMSVGPGQSVTITQNYPGGYTGQASAGIYNLLVNGLDTDAFCIDVSRSVFGQPVTYDVVDLDTAPNLPVGPMGTSAADQIKKLWAMNYAAATGSASIAADLQVAIWKTVATGATPYPFAVFGHAGADAMILAAQTYSGSVPNLVGLVNDYYQSYTIVQLPSGSVADGGTTLALLGLALTGLAVARRKLKIR